MNKAEEAMELGGRDALRCVFFCCPAVCLFHCPAGSGGITTPACGHPFWEKGNGAVAGFFVGKQLTTA